MAGLYFHIPFCKRVCAYCDFYSLPRSEEKMDAYTAALLRHIEEVAPRTAAHRVDTVYFGGGTPSYLGTKRLIRLLKTVQKKYRLDKQAEITLEANPDSAGDWKELRALLEQYMQEDCCTDGGGSADFFSGKNKFPYGPKRGDHLARREEELARMPAGYEIDI